MTIGALVLAAGSSRRFGDDKRKALLPSGVSVIDQSIETALRAFGHVIVVVRHGDHVIADELREKFDSIQTFNAPESALGMGHSLANAIGEISDWRGAFIFLADMPHIKVSTLQDLKSAFEEDESSEPIIVPTYQSQYGHPVGFHQTYYEQLAQLQGDNGARSVIQENSAKVIEIAVDDAGVIQDVDVPADLSDT